MRSLLVAAVLLAASCGGDDQPAPKPAPSPPPRRVIDPPEGLMRSGPPYAIRADGVGPYKPGDAMEAIQEQLRDLRVARLDLPGHHTLIRVDNEAIIIGGDPNTTRRVTFVGVLGGAEIARTDSGIHVGSTRDELVAALGPSLDEPERARDPRLVAVAAMRPVRFVVEGERGRDKIVAIVVGVEPRAPAQRVPDVGPQPAPCARPSPAAVEGHTFGACFTGTSELVDIDGEDVTIRPADSERATFAFRIPNLMFAAPLRNAAEQRDELIAVTRSDDAQQRVWSVIGYRFDGKAFVRAIDPTPVYQLSQTRWSGDLRDIDLYFELTSRPDGIEVGGLLTSRTNDRIRAVVSIAPVAIARRHGRSTAESGGDAGVSDVVDAMPPLDANPRGGAGSAKP